MTPIYGFNNWFFPFGVPGVAEVKPDEFLADLANHGARYCRWWTWSQPLRLAGFAAAYPTSATLDPDALVALEDFDATIARSGGIQPAFGSNDYYRRLRFMAEAFSRLGIGFSAMLWNWHPAEPDNERRYSVDRRTEGERVAQVEHIRRTVEAVKVAGPLAMIEVMNEAPERLRDWQRWAVREVRRVAPAEIKILVSSGYGRGSDSHDGLASTGADVVAYSHPFRSSELPKAARPVTLFDTDHSLLGLNTRDPREMVALMDSALAGGYTFSSLLPIVGATIPGYPPEQHPWNDPRNKAHAAAKARMLELAGKAKPPKPDKPAPEPEPDAPAPPKEPEKPEKPDDEREDDPAALFYRAVERARELPDRDAARADQKLHRLVRRLGRALGKE